MNPSRGSIVFVVDWVVATYSLLCLGTLDESGSSIAAKYSRGSGHGIQGQNSSTIDGYIGVYGILGRV